MGGADLARDAGSTRRRGGLSTAPALYTLADEKPQAFTIGERHDAAIVVSVGLMRILNRREMAGVLAHEVSHVINDDIRLLRLASILGYVTAGLARAMAVVALIGLPLILTGALSLSPSALIAIAFAPLIAQALLLSLSRTREHAADAGAVALTGDPEGLASALARLEARNSTLLERWLGMRRRRAAGWLQTHPATSTRIRRLMGGATSRKPRTVAPGPGRFASGPHRARVVVRRGPRTTILRAV